MKQAILWALAYLMGCITLGPILARFRGVDLRSVGSGNIGATNVLRAMGKTAAVLTLLGDVLKGSVAVVIARFFLDQSFDVGLAGLFAVLGHNFPVFLGFKGGKGVATSLGVLVAYLPWLAFGFAVSWLLVFAVSRISSLSALCGFLTVSVIAYVSYKEQFLIVFALFVLTGVLHRQNILRLLRGTEPRFGSSSESGTRGLN